jgi:hypothetical protein
VAATETNGSIYTEWTELQKTLVKSNGNRWLLVSGQKHGSVKHEYMTQKIARIAEIRDKYCPLQKRLKTYKLIALTEKTEQT